VNYNPYENHHNTSERNETHLSSRVYGVDEGECLIDVNVLDLETV
jgi:hypothetical protein